VIRKFENTKYVIRRRKLRTDNTTRKEIKIDNDLQWHYTSGAGTVYPSGAPEFTPVFSCVRVTRSLVIVCPVVLFLLVIVLPVLLRYTDSDYLPLVSSNSSSYTEN
jgi:hypothetical protein